MLSARLLPRSLFQRVCQGPRNKTSPRRGDVLFLLRLGGAILHRAGLVHGDAAATHVRTIEHGDRFVSRGVVGHLDEREVS